jgi:dephospho-CoA kinase
MSATADQEKVLSQKETQQMNESSSQPDSSQPEERPASEVLVIALTGGIASGKSTVGKLMRELGCTVTDADELVAQLYLPDSPGSIAVRELFGNEMLTPSGAVDKEALAKRVFADPEARKRLEKAIHPLVGQAFAELVRSSRGIVVFEVPLLAESGRKPHYPFIITVEADRDMRLERAVQRGMCPEDAAARMQAQASREQREALATHVIENDGSLEKLRRRVAAIVSEIQSNLDA